MSGVRYDYVEQSDNTQRNFQYSTDVEITANHHYALHDS